MRRRGQRPEGDMYGPAAHMNVAGSWLARPKAPAPWKSRIQSAPSCRSNKKNAFLQTLTILSPQSWLASPRNHLYRLFCPVIHQLPVPSSAEEYKAVIPGLRSGAVGTGQGSGIPTLDKAIPPRQTRLPASVFRHRQRSKHTSSEPPWSGSGSVSGSIEPAGPRRRRASGEKLWVLLTPTWA